MYRGQITEVKFIFQTIGVSVQKKKVKPLGVWMQFTPKSKGPWDTVSQKPKQRGGRCVWGRPAEEEEGPPLSINQIKVGDKGSAEG